VRFGLNANQSRGLFAAFGGVALDGVDSFIYALVLVPAMRDLLPQSGIAATTGNLGLYGSVLFASFLVGWGLGFAWGPLADRYGRVRMLMLAIICYSLFTFLGAFAHRWWILGLFRLLAGFGIGGEFVGAATFVAEELPESRRVFGAGIMNSGYYVGNLIAAFLNYTVGAAYGWRLMFAIGGLPALFVAYVRSSVHEPERWRSRRQQIGRWRARDAFLLLFAPEYRRQTILNCIFVLISMIGLWAGSVYAASAVTELAQRQGYPPQTAARVASQATMLLSCGTIAACLVMPWMVEAIGRRGAVAVFYAMMAAAISVGFGVAFYLPHQPLRWFIVCLLFVGMGGGAFSVYWVWLSEQYRTECRGSALALATCIGRFAAAGATFIVGLGISSYGSIGVPVALTALPFIVGLALVPFGVETRGRPLPP
jgi:MFS family permease